MTISVTDLFCGAGGASLAAEAVGDVQLVMAANHWSKAIEVHQANFPAARHDLADISQVDFRRYPRTDILLAGCECTNHSQAKGISRQRQHANLFEGPDPGAERSRATMWDAVRYIEVHRPAAVIVENVVEAARWLYWEVWCSAFDVAGYTLTVCSINSMHTGIVPQSRDRIYVVAVRKGITVDLEFRPPAWCRRCDRQVEARQSWKNGRTVGRYRQQYLWRCATCNTAVEPAVVGAERAIDWALPSQRIGDRTRPLAPATMRRIRLGIEKYGTTVYQAAGNTYERPGSGYHRSWPTTEPLPTQTTTVQQGVAGPPGALIAELRGGSSTASPVTDPLATVTASGNHHGLVCPPLIDVQRTNHAPAAPVTEPLHTMVAGTVGHALVCPPQPPGAMYVKNYTSRNQNVNGGMVHPVTDPFGSVTTIDHHALLVPYYRTGIARPVTEPMGTVETRDRQALLGLEVDLDDCTFRMLEPHEIGAAMAFPASYLVEGTKKDRVRLYGNAWTPPVGTWIIGRVVQALEAAA
jgi:DNA (cytosine-5)-methyltransferase 1